MEASQVVWHKGLFRHQIPTCSVLAAMQLSEHGAALQESFWAQQHRASVSYELCYSICSYWRGRSHSRKEPVWGLHWPVAGCYRPEALRTLRGLPGAPSGVRSCPQHGWCHLLTRLTLPGQGAGYSKAKPGEQPGCSREGCGETQKPCCSLHPCCTVTRFLGKCRRCLAALAVSAGSHQLLLPPLRLLIRPQHWPSKLLSESRWFPLEISRCSSPVKLETTPSCSPFAVCWVRHLWHGAGLLLARSWGQEELNYRHRSPASSWGKILACALACMGMAVLMCHLSSQFNLEMTKEQILTSAALARLSRYLWSAAVLPEPSASLPGAAASLPGTEHPF